MHPGHVGEDRAGEISGEGGQDPATAGPVRARQRRPGTHAARSIGGAVGQLTGTLATALRERRQTVRALAGCSLLADLLDAEPDIDAQSYYSYLLAWEFTRIPTEKAVVPVVLLDTFEDTGDRTHRDLERLMPIAFFIVTGRSRLQWADPALQGQLDYTGPTVWPGLAQQAVPGPRPAGASGNGRQVRIGDFSPQDCDDYLARRLVRDGQPPSAPNCGPSSPTTPTACPSTSISPCSASWNCGGPDIPRHRRTSTPTSPR
ncbi:hypothetical protein ACFRFL_21930 [Streptomyces sp. NPDC056708]|uniref:hypothetical protein n=1 Tax=unclassified Streptomyces TaxID=2593676 RepID=UPI00367C0F8D